MGSKRTGSKRTKHLAGLFGCIAGVLFSTLCAWGIYSTALPGESLSANPATDGPPYDWTVVQEGMQGQPEVEMAVLQALSYEPHNKGAAYDINAGIVRVTVFSPDYVFSDEELNDLRMRAEAVTNGIPVIVGVEEVEAKLAI